MRIALSLFAVFGLTGCPGTAPPNQTVQPDAEVDAPVEETAFLMTGKAKDYFGMTAVGEAMLATDGLDPPQMATTATDGGFSIEVSVGAKLFVLATKTGYRPTRSEAITVADASLMRDVYMTATQDVTNQYTGVGATPTVGTAFLAAELRRTNNQPVDGIPLTNIQLLDAVNQPVAGVKGPYVFNASGALDTTVTMATAYQGRSRIAYLDVPPGTHRLVVAYTMNNTTQTDTTSVTAVADGTTLALSGGGMGGGPAITDPSFATHIYPKLQRAAAGGLGCANCHTLTGPAAVLKYDDPAATVLANIMARPGVINATTPADSLLLKRPLYEQPPAPQDHPNATFIDINDADYKLFLLWIMNGAKP